MDGQSTEALIGLGDAIGAVRAELTSAMDDGAHQRLRFHPSAVQLTVEAAVTRTGTGNAGIKWWVIEIGGERSRERVATQTLKLTLEPVGFDALGRPRDVLLSEDDDAVDDRADPVPPPDESD